jgi:hypothetical protein
MSGKARKFREDAHPEITISVMENGQLRVEAIGRAYLPLRKLGELMGNGYVYQRPSRGGRVVLLTPPKGKLLVACNEQVVAKLKSQGFVQGLGDHFKRSLLIHGLEGREYTVPLTRQQPPRKPRKPHRRSSRPRPRKWAGAAAA